MIPDEAQKEIDAAIAASISFFGAGKSILFKKKITPRITTKIKANFIVKLIILVLELVFLINCI